MNSNNDPTMDLLERELRNLQPLPPDPAFMNRLQRAMTEPMQDRAPTTNIISFPQKSTKEENRVSLKPWAAVAACAVAATGAITWNQSRLAADNAALANSAGKPFVPQYVQKSSDSQFHRVQQGELVIDPKNGVMRKLRFEFNNRQQYVDPSSGALLEVRYPSEEEVFILEPVQ